MTIVLAQKRAVVTPTSTSSIKVTVTPPDYTMGITKYEVTLMPTYPTKKCEIGPRQTPFACYFYGLQAGKYYTVDVCPWNVFTQRCADHLFGNGYTKPNAPVFVTLETISTSLMRVRVEAPVDARGIGYFQAVVSGVQPTISCKIYYPGSTSCLLQGLKQGRLYTVAVSSCIFGSNPLVCSDNRTTSAWTKFDSYTTSSGIVLPVTMVAVFGFVIAISAALLVRALRHAKMNKDQSTQAQAANGDLPAPPPYPPPAKQPQATNDGTLAPPAYPPPVYDQVIGDDAIRKEGL
uniref:Fibronectin type-III domain-containing protein n=1 Tax=Mesocestoides corti TaxID=53468 RepID=A0A5K3FWM9_MESCO